MIVVCRKVLHYETKKDLGLSSPWLKVGNEYVVLGMTLVEKVGSQIYIQSENYGDPTFFDLDGFEFIDQTIPSSWITVFSEVCNRREVNLIPESWNYDSFFEDILDEEAKAVELFKKESRKIYREVGWIS